MGSLQNKKSTWELVKAIGTAVCGGFIPIGLGCGGIGLAMSLAKATVTTLAVAGAGGALVLGGAAAIAGVLMVGKIEKEIERMTPHLSASDLKKMIPAIEPAEPAPAPDLSKEFSQGVDNVETMKPLRLKSQAEASNDGGVMKALRFRPRTDNQNSTP